MPAHDISIVQEMSWNGVKNGELLNLAEANFDVLITCDQNLRYQQNLKDRKLAFIILPSNQVPIVEALLPTIESTLTIIKANDLIEIPLP